MSAKKAKTPAPAAPAKDLAGTPTNPHPDVLRREFNLALDRMANKLIRTMHVMIEKRLGATNTEGQS